MRKTEETLKDDVFVRKCFQRNMNTDSNTYMGRVWLVFSISEESL